MAYPAGFSYVKGPVSYVLSRLSSTCTARARNPVTLSDDRTVIEATSDTSAIYGISAHDAADSTRAGYMLVEIPTADTIYAAPIQTGVATSVYSVGQCFGLEKSGNHLRPDTDSAVSFMVQVVPRDDYSTAASDDSSVWVHWLGDVLGVFSSNASFAVYAQD